MVHHRRGLRRLIADDELVADVDALREAGFSDRDILDITEVVGYYAYANRIADGLGLQTEDWIPD
ncbi:MAG: hypothetical protein F4190_12545 [Acidimicrobiales bacterium]|nr:hypothetical protein [Acidimicrobiales bacterium]MYI26603.1 hypothetical protein [Acidimicrobiales bacterium]